MERNIDGRNSTSKERDAETGLDYFGARYYSGAQGRFTSPDPIYFQSEMLLDPQRWNQYAYVRNNPLAFVDPKGTAIELTGVEEERRKKLAALKDAVGTAAGSYLYENAVTSKDAKGNDVTQYFVGIYTNGPDGKGSSFESINPMSGALGSIINDKRVAAFDLVPAGTKLDLSNGYRPVIDAIGSGVGPAATYTGKNGKFHVAVMDWASKPYGSIPGGYMSDGNPGPVDSGILTGHEFGHVQHAWSPWYQRLFGSSNASALRLENAVRKIWDPSAATRQKH